MCHVSVCIARDVNGLVNLQCLLSNSKRMMVVDFSLKVITMTVTLDTITYTDPLIANSVTKTILRTCYLLSKDQNDTTVQARHR